MSDQSILRITPELDTEQIKSEIRELAQTAISSVEEVSGAGGRTTAGRETTVEEQPEERPRRRLPARREEEPLRQIGRSAAQQAAQLIPAGSTLEQSRALRTQLTRTFQEAFRDLPREIVRSLRFGPQLAEEVRNRERVAPPPRQEPVVPVAQRRRPPVREAAAPIVREPVVPETVVAPVRQPRERPTVATAPPIATTPEREPVTAPTAPRVVPEPIPRTTPATFRTLPSPSDAERLQRNIADWQLAAGGVGVASATTIPAVLGLTAGRLSPAQHTQLHANIQDLITTNPSTTGVGFTEGQKRELGQSFQTVITRVQPPPPEVTAVQSHQFRDQLSDAIRRPLQAAVAPLPEGLARGVLLQPPVARLSLTTDFEQLRQSLRELVAAIPRPAVPEPVRPVAVGQQIARTVAPTEPLTVVRVNRQTVTARTETGETIRVPHAQVVVPTVTVESVAPLSVERPGPVPVEAVAPLRVERPGPIAIDHVGALPVNRPAPLEIEHLGPLPVAHFGPVEIAHFPPLPVAHFGPVEIEKPGLIPVEKPEPARVAIPGIIPVVQSQPVTGVAPAPPAPARVIPAVSPQVQSILPAVAPRPLVISGITPPINPVQFVTRPVTAVAVEPTIATPVVPRSITPVITAAPIIPVRPPTVTVVPPAPVRVQNIGEIPVIQPQPARVEGLPVIPVNRPAPLDIEHVGPLPVAHFGPVEIAHFPPLPVAHFGPVEIAHFPPLPVDVPRSIAVEPPPTVRIIAPATFTAEPEPIASQVRRAITPVGPVLRTPVVTAGPQEVAAALRPPASRTGVVPVEIVKPQIFRVEHVGALTSGVIRSTTLTPAPVTPIGVGARAVGGLGSITASTIRPPGVPGPVEPNIVGPTLTTAPDRAHAVGQQVVVPPRQLGFAQRSEEAIGVTAPVVGARTEPLINVPRRFGQNQPRLPAPAATPQVLETPPTPAPVAETPPVVVGAAPPRRPPTPPPAPPATPEPIGPTGPAPLTGIATPAQRTTGQAALAAEVAGVGNVNKAKAALGELFEDVNKRAEQYTAAASSAELLGNLEDVARIRQIGNYFQHISQQVAAFNHELSLTDEATLPFAAAAGSAAEASRRQGFQTSGLGLREALGQPAAPETLQNLETPTLQGVVAALRDELNARANVTRYENANADLIARANAAQQALNNAVTAAQVAYTDQAASVRAGIARADEQADRRAGIFRGRNRRTGAEETQARQGFVAGVRQVNVAQGFTAQGRPATTEAEDRRLRDRLVPRILSQGAQLAQVGGFTPRTNTELQGLSTDQLTSLSKAYQTEINARTTVAAAEQQNIPALVQARQSQVRQNAIVELLANSEALQRPFTLAQAQGLPTRQITGLNQGLRREIQANNVIRGQFAVNPEVVAQAAVVRRQSNIVNEIVVRSQAIRAPITAAAAHALTPEEQQATLINLRERQTAAGQVAAIPLLQQGTALGGQFPRRRAALIQEIAQRGQIIGQPQRVEHLQNLELPDLLTLNASLKLLGQQALRLATVQTASADGQARVNAAEADHRAAVDVLTGQYINAGQQVAAGIAKEDRRAETQAGVVRGRSPEAQAGLRQAQQEAKTQVQLIQLPAGLPPQQETQARQLIANVQAQRTQAESIGDVRGIRDADLRAEALAVALGSLTREVKNPYTSQFVGQITGRQPTRFQSLLFATRGGGSGGGGGGVGGGPSTGAFGEPTFGQFAGRHAVNTLGYIIPGIAFGVLFEGLRQGLEEAAETQKTLAEVQAEFTALGQGNQFGGYSQAIQNIASQTGVAVNEVADLGLAFKGVFGNTQQATIAVQAAAQGIQALGVPAAQLQEDLTGISQAFDSLRGQQGSSFRNIQNQALHLQDIFGVPAGQTLAGTADIAAIANQLGFTPKFTQGLVAVTAQRSGFSGTDIGSAFARILPGFSTAVPQLLQVFSGLGAKGQPFINQISAGNTQQAFVDFEKVFPSLSAGLQNTLIQTLGGNPSSRGIFIAASQGLGAPGAFANINSNAPANRLQEEVNKQLSTVAGSLEKFGADIANLGEQILASDLGRVFADIVTAGGSLIDFLTQINGATHGLLGNIAATYLAFRTAGAILTAVSSAGGVRQIAGTVLGGGGILRRGTLNTAQFNEAVTGSSRSFSTTVVEAANQFAAKIAGAGTDLDAAAVAGGEKLDASAVAAGAALKVGGAEGGLAAGATGAEAGVVAGAGAGEAAAGAGAGEAAAGAGVLAAGLNVALVAVIAYQIIGQLTARYPKQIQTVDNAILHPPGQAAESRFVNRLNLNSLIIPPGGNSPTSQGVAAYNQYLREQAGSSTPYKVNAQEQVNTALQKIGATPIAVGQRIPEAERRRIRNEIGSTALVTNVETDIGRGGRTESPRLIASLDRLTSSVDRATTAQPVESLNALLGPSRGPQAPESVNAATRPTGVAQQVSTTISPLAQLTQQLQADFTASASAYSEGLISFGQLEKSAETTVKNLATAYKLTPSPANLEAYTAALAQQKALADTQAQTIAQFAQNLQQQGSPTAALAGIAIGFKQLATTSSPTAVQSVIQGIVQQAQTFISNSANLQTSTEAANAVAQQGYTFSKTNTQRIIGSLESVGLNYQQAIDSLNSVGIQLTKTGQLKVRGQFVTPLQQFQGVQQQLQATQTLQQAQAFENPQIIAQEAVTFAQKTLSAYTQNTGQTSGQQFKTYQAALLTAQHNLIDLSYQTTEAQLGFFAAVFSADPVAAAQAQLGQAETALNLAKRQKNNPSAILAAETSIAQALQAGIQAQVQQLQAVGQVQVAVASGGGGLLQAQAQFSLDSDILTQNLALQAKYYDQMKPALQKQYGSLDNYLNSLTSVAQERATVKGDPVAIIQAQTQTLQAAGSAQVALSNAINPLQGALTQLSTDSQTLNATLASTTTYFNANAKNGLVQGKTLSEYINSNSSILSLIQQRTADAANLIQSSGQTTQQLGATEIAAAGTLNQSAQATAQFNIDTQAYQAALEAALQFFASHEVGGKFKGLTQGQFVAQQTGVQQFAAQVTSDAGNRIQAQAQQVQALGAVQIASAGGINQLAQAQAQLSVDTQAYNAAVAAATQAYQLYVRSGGKDTLQRYLATQSTVIQLQATRRTDAAALIGAEAQQTQAFGATTIALAGAIGPVGQATAQLNVDTQAYNAALQSATSYFKTYEKNGKLNGLTLQQYLASQQTLIQLTTAKKTDSVSLIQAEVQQTQAFGALRVAQVGLQGQPYLSALAQQSADANTYAVYLQKETALYQANKGTYQKLGISQNAFLASNQQLAQLQTTVLTDQANTMQAVVSQDTNVVQSQLTLGQITVQQGIAVLYADLQKVKGNQAATLQLETTIRQLQNSAGSNLSFNLPQTLIPSTLYTARLAEASRGNLGVVGPTTNNVTVNIQGGSASSWQAGINKISQAFGGPTTTIPNENALAR